MKIEHFSPNEEDNEISFPVMSSKFTAIVEHLRTKGIAVGGNHSDSDMSEVVAPATIDKVNEALKDFVG